MAEIGNPVLRRLLKSLPPYLDRDAQAAPGITLTYNGSAASLWIQRRKLWTKVSGGTGTSREVALAGKTLTQLVTTMNGWTGYTASMVASSGGLPAISLLEVEGQDLSREPQVRRFTSLLWNLLAPISWIFLDTIDNAKIALLQGTTKTAEGLWVDLWGGDYYGEVRRRSGELDRPYAERIIREFLRWRLNNGAIQNIIKEETGLECTVVNLFDQAFCYNATTHGYGAKYAAYRYQRTTFEIQVTTPPFDTSTFRRQIELLVERNRAAGTMPFYLFTSPLVIFTDQVTGQKYSVNFGPPPVLDPTTATPAVSGWDLGNGQWLIVSNGVLTGTDVAVVGAVPCPPDITITITGGGITYEMSV
jgi:hypothetical protein